jgi:predicted ATPase
MLTTPRTNLPAELTSFVGRADAVAEVVRLLEDARLLSLTGPGGIGKTRIALRAAVAALGTRADGVWLVELASIVDPGLLPQTVAEALALEGLGPGPTTDALCRALRSKQLLLVLDNCEHLVAGCADVVAAVLRAAPGVSVLATALRRSSRASSRRARGPTTGEASSNRSAARTQPLTTIRGRSRATGRTIPARWQTATTSATSL